MSATATVADRFWSKVSGGDVSECWIWTAARSGGGRSYRYGSFHDHGRHVRAHRWSYESLIATIPPGLHLDHLCRNPICVNPWHLDPVPLVVNAARTRLTHCKNGHELTPENTYLQRRSAERVDRSCKTCVDQRSARARLRARQQIEGTDGIGEGLSRLEPGSVSNPP